MAKVITTELQHSGASGANITLDSSKNVTFGGNVSVTGTLPADKLTGALPAISGANLTGISSPLSFRNKIINGSFWVWQRGTSGFDTNDEFTADRWRMIESGGTGVVSRQAFTVGSEIAGSEYYLNYNVSTASDYTGLKYRIENVKSIEPGTWTISFWAKHTSAGPNGGLMIRGGQEFGSGGSTGVSLTSPAAITTTTSWVRYSKQITIPSISGKTVGAGSYLQLEIGQGSNAGTGAWNLDIANVQFEKGSTVTDFEQKGYAQELLDCQRYYQLLVIGVDGDTMYYGGAGSWYAASAAYQPINLPVFMRTGPSATWSTGTGYFQLTHNGTNDSTDDPAGWYGSWVGGGALYYQGGQNNLSNGTAGHSFIASATETAAWIALSAEL